jgi:hypothetical protein
MLSFIHFKRQESKRKLNFLKKNAICQSIDFRKFCSLDRIIKKWTDYLNLFNFNEGI